MTFGMLASCAVSPHVRLPLSMPLCACALGATWVTAIAPGCSVVCGVVSCALNGGSMTGFITWMVAVPLLIELCVPATFFLSPGGFGSRVERMGDAGMIVTEAQARTLHGAGFELGSHTLSHRNVLELSDDDLAAELAGSKQAIERLTGERCATLAYPTGRHDARVRRMAQQAGYELAFACRPGPWRRFAIQSSTRF